MSGQMDNSTVTLCVYITRVVQITHWMSLSLFAVLWKYSYPFFLTLLWWWNIRVTRFFSTLLWRSCWSGSALFLRSETRSLNTHNFKISPLPFSLLSKVFLHWPHSKPCFKNVPSRFQKPSSVLDCVELVWVEQIAVVTLDNVNCSNTTTPRNWFLHHVMFNFPLKKQVSEVL
jgi:hypothetical protein